MNRPDAPEGHAEDQSEPLADEGVREEPAPGAADESPDAPRSGPEARVRAALGRLKVLPLPSGVLLPGASLFLWLYEPRQRALIQDALAEDGVLAVALTVPPDEQHPRGRLRRVAGAGVVERHRRLAGGAWEVELRGVARVRLAGEVASPRPYRLMSAEAIEELPGQAPFVAELRRLVLELAPTVVGRGAEELKRAATAEPDPGVLANLAASALIEEPEARQAVLEEREPGRRIALVLGGLGALLLSLRGAAGPLARG